MNRQERLCSVTPSSTTTMMTTTTTASPNLETSTHLREATAPARKGKLEHETAPLPSAAVVVHQPPPQPQPHPLATIRVTPQPKGESTTGTTPSNTTANRNSELKYDSSDDEMAMLQERDQLSHLLEFARRSSPSPPSLPPPPNNHSGPGLTHDDAPASIVTPITAFRASVPAAAPPAVAPTAAAAAAIGGKHTTTPPSRFSLAKKPEDKELRRSNNYDQHQQQHRHHQQQQEHLQSKRPLPPSPTGAVKKLARTIPPQGKSSLVLERNNSQKEEGIHKLHHHPPFTREDDLVVVPLQRLERHMSDHARDIVRQMKNTISIQAPPSKEQSSITNTTSSSSKAVTTVSTSSQQERKDKPWNNTSGGDSIRAIIAKAPEPAKQILQRPQTQEKSEPTRRKFSAEKRVLIKRLRPCKMVSTTFGTSATRNLVRRSMSMSRPTGNTTLGEANPSPTAARRLTGFTSNTIANADAKLLGKTPPTTSATITKRDDTGAIGKSRGTCADVGDDMKLPSYGSKSSTAAFSSSPSFPFPSSSTAPSSFYHRNRMTIKERVTYAMMPAFQLGSKDTATTRPRLSSEKKSVGHQGSLLIEGDNSMKRKNGDQLLKAEHNWTNLTSASASLYVADNKAIDTSTKTSNESSYTKHKRDDNVPKDQASPSPKSSLPRVPPKLVYEGPPTKPLDFFPGGWPEGWIERRYERMSGTSKGHCDPYWYSPMLQKRIRSIPVLKSFLTLLEMYGGDEELAYRNLTTK